MKNTNYYTPVYKIYTDKIEEKQVKVVSIADLHNYTYNEEKAENLAQAIKKEEPHHIIIAGDILQGYEWEDIEKLKKLKKFLESLSEGTKIFISQGNHDLITNKTTNPQIRDRNFRELERVRPGNIYPLINDKVIINGFEIIGYTPQKSIIDNLGNQIHGYAHDRFITEYMEKAVKPSNNSKNIIEFVGHNPHLIGQSENNIGLEDLQRVNTFFTGHLHNGYIPTDFTQKKPKKYLDLGLVEKPYTNDKDGKIILTKINPLIIGLTNLTRGVIFLNSDCKQVILELTNNLYFLNISKEKNKQKWIAITKHIAKKIIEIQNLKALIISGGINKYLGKEIKSDKPEITIVKYKRKK